MSLRTTLMGGGLIVLTLACSKSNSNSSPEGSSGSGARPEAGAAGEDSNGGSGAGAGASAGLGGTAGGGAGAGFGGTGGDGAAGVRGGTGGNGGAGASPGGAAGAAGADCRTTGCMEGRECLSRPGNCEAGFGCWNPETLDCAERPVCGCDGQSYASRCAALEAGTWVGPVSECETPPNRFPCVSEFCDTESEYCEITNFITNPLGACPLDEPYTTGRCVALPDDCRANPSCACMLPCRYPGGGCDDAGPLTRTCMDGCVG
jgi:hypothetical protein